MSSCIGNFPGTLADCTWARVRRRTLSFLAKREGIALILRLFLEGRQADREESAALNCFVPREAAIFYPSRLGALGRGFLELIGEIVAQIGQAADLEVGGQQIPRGRALQDFLEDVVAQLGAVEVIEEYR
jgi:hypothetical protein